MKPFGLISVLLVSEGAIAWQRLSIDAKLIALKSMSLVMDPSRLHLALFIGMVCGDDVTTRGLPIGLTSTGDLQCLAEIRWLESRLIIALLIRHQQYLRMSYLSVIVRLLLNGLYALTVSPPV